MKKKDKIFIIAEVGVNHNGSLKKALKLVDLAVSAGADAIKFQTFKAENLATKNAPKADYQILNSSKKETQFKMLKKLEFTDSMHRTCLNECKKKKIIFMSSAFDINNLYYLKKLNLKYFKVPSGEITNIPYLEVLGKFNKKVILSTGMSSINEIEQAIKILKKNGTSKNKIVLMQCTSAYPAPNEEMNLKIINTFINRFKLKVGLSDHSLGTQAPIAAVSLGATLIEKHMTLDNNLQGPDHKASLNPMDFKLMVKNIRITEQMLGSKKKKITKTEKKNIKIVRKSIVALKKIKKNEKFSKLNITCKRPGTGISPVYYNKILGKKSIKNYNLDDLIKLN
jgi:N,N'-diacetyllegionaminate synthase|tara:strand:+ start:12714 stop:13730 length:1017 start_codon:yes stop_codon:yes gene_type:complete